MGTHNLRLIQLRLVLGFLLLSRLESLSQVLNLEKVLMSRAFDLVEWRSLLVHHASLLGTRHSSGLRQLINIVTKVSNEKRYTYKLIVK